MHPYRIAAKPMSGRMAPMARLELVARWNAGCARAVLDLMCGSHNGPRTVVPRPVCSQPPASSPPENVRLQQELDEEQQHEDSLVARVQELHLRGVPSLCIRKNRKGTKTGQAIDPALASRSTDAWSGTTDSPRLPSQGEAEETRPEPKKVI